jgi:nucleoside-diphosphate-sugar epimerase
MHVFLTGGTGLLGSHLAEELRSTGDEVVALCRPGADTLFLEELGCTVVEGDVRDEPEALAPLMEGCTHLVHGAALVYTDGSWPQIRAVNVDGTRNVLTAAAQADVGLALHVSSVAVYGPSDGPVDEDTPLDTDLAATDLYARSKREAEEVARGIEDVQGLRVAVARPCAVYGERDRLMSPALARIARLPVVPLMGRGNNAIPAVYAGNVAGALRRMLEDGRGGTTYDVGSDHPLTQRGLLECLSRGLGVRATFVSIPAGVIRGGASLLDWFGAHAPDAKHLSISRVVSLALGENPYQSRRLRDELGWDPTHTHEEALERTGRWLANQA